MSVMRAIRRYKWPQNDHTADIIRFVPHFRELQLSWTAGAVMSDGMEKFVEEFLPRIRANNPQISYRLHRSHVDCDPFVVGMHELKILATVQQLSLGGDFRTGIRLGVTSRLPRGQEILDIETRGHDVFTVYSKYKGDPIDPNQMTSMKHPHLKYQPMIRKKHCPPTF